GEGGGGGAVIGGGGVIGVEGGGRPVAFQELMRRFRRTHGVEALAREMPLALFFFDCLVAAGRSLVDDPYEARWRALAEITGGRDLAAAAVPGAADAGRSVHARRAGPGARGGGAEGWGRGRSPGRGTAGDRFTRKPWTPGTRA